MIITSANSTVVLGVQSLYGVPVQIYGYSVDDMFDSDEVEFQEKYMGVDGFLSAGFVPYIVPLNLNLQADSPSNTVMDAIILAEKTTRQKLVLDAIIKIPALSRIFTFTNGFLDRGPVMPSAGKVLKPRKFSMIFQDMTPAPM